MVYSLKNTILVALFVFYTNQSILRLLPQNNGGSAQDKSQQQIVKFIFSPQESVNLADYRDNQQASIFIKNILGTPRCLKVGVFDYEEHLEPSFFQAWEDEEEGSTINVLKAYKTIVVNKFYEKPLSLEVIGQIRINLANQGGNYQELGEQGTETQITGDMMRFGLPEDLDGNYIQKIEEHIEDLKQRLQISDDYTYPYRYEESDHKIYASDETVDQKEAWITSLLTKYEQDISQIVNIDQNQVTREQQFLETLALLMIDLERMHPYADFNARTFGVFLLNKELLRQKMQPSVMDNINKMDYLTKEELVQEIKKGQLNYQNILNEKYVDIQGQNQNNVYSQIIDNTQTLYDISIIFCSYSDDQIINIFEGHGFTEQQLKIFRRQAEQQNLTIDQLKQNLKDYVKGLPIYQLMYLTLGSIESYKQKMDNQIESYFVCRDNVNEYGNMQQVKNRIQILLDSLDDQRRVLLQNHSEKNRIFLL